MTSLTEEQLFILREQALLQLKTEKEKHEYITLKDLMIQHNFSLSDPTLTVDEQPEDWKIRLAEMYDYKWKRSNYSTWTLKHNW